jgi:predicted alpha/beta hydrolase family esterase
VLIVPGIGNSGPGHWQTLWQDRHPRWRRVAQRDWDHPTCEQWVEAFEVAMAETVTPPVLVAHSIGCLVVAHWASRSARKVLGAFFVAVPDPQAPAFPSSAKGFAQLPLARFAFPSLVVASADDAFGSVEYARRCAAAWGSEFVDIGQAGHINADSGHGEWAEGWLLFERFVTRATSAP